MEETPLIITDEVLAKLVFTYHLVSQNPYCVTRRRVSPDIEYTDKFIESTFFIESFNKFLSSIRAGDKHPLDSITLSNQQLLPNTVSIRKDVIPFLKSSKRTFQLISRRKKTAFGEKLSNPVLLGNLLEVFDKELTTIICNISTLFTDDFFQVGDSNLSLPAFKDTIFYSKLVQNIPSNTLNTTKFSTSDFYFDTKLILDRESGVLTSPSSGRYFRREYITSLENSDYIQKTYICILENIYFYLSLFLGIYYNHLIGSGVLYNKAKDRHRITMPPKNMFSGLRNNPYSGNYQNSFFDSKKSSIIGHLGFLFSAMDNIQQTLQENVVNIKTQLMSFRDVSHSHILEGVKELDKILLIFNGFKTLTDTLYKEFMVESPFESVLISCKKQESVSDVFVPLASYIYGDFKGVDPKLVEKISFGYFNGLLALPLSAIKTSAQFIINKREDIGRKESSPLNAMSNSVKQTYVILSVPNVRFINKIANESFMDYWINKADMPIFTIDSDELLNEGDQNSPRLQCLSTLSDIVRDVIVEYLYKNDKFTGDKKYTDPFDFKLLRTQLFCVVPPGGRNYERLAKRTLTVAEKVGISLLVLGPSIQQGKEDDFWRKSSVPEFGVKVSHAKSK